MDERELGLPLRTQLVLVALQGVALCIVLLLWHDSPLFPGNQGFRRIQNVSPQYERPVSAKARFNNTSLTQAQAETSITPGSPGTSALNDENLETEGMLAKIELLAALSQQEPAREAPEMEGQTDRTVSPFISIRHAVSRLKPYGLSDNETVRHAAESALAPLFLRLDAQARGAARTAAEVAENLASDERFSEAADVLRNALQALPQDTPWSHREGAPRLKAVLEKLAAQSEQACATSFAGIEEGLKRGEPLAKKRLTALLAHPEASFRKAAEGMQARLRDEKTKEVVSRLKGNAEARAAWLEFFQKFDAAIESGDFDAANDLCHPVSTSRLLSGGVLEPRKVLDGCGADIAAIQKLYEEALEKARNSKQSVELSMRRGHVTGHLDGVAGRQIQVAVAGGGKVGVKVETLTAEGLRSILGQEGAALCTLNAYEKTAQAQVILFKCSATNGDIPWHWAQRFRLEKFNSVNDDAEHKLQALNEALRAGAADAIKDALEAARPLLAEYETFEPLNDERKKIVSDAEAIAGHAARQRLVLQNGATVPARASEGVAEITYGGLNTDQISEYRDAARSTDVGVKRGLKLGASGGLQRVLVHFEGLEAAISNSRVRRATLEFYQVDSPQSAGAVIGLFRLKKPWVPDSGTWISYDSGKKSDWAIPGASGDGDVESKEDSKVSIDKQKNLWRAWDVTKYVQDVLDGKAQNHGLLLRVMNGEPEYHVRLYPETDMESLKDKSLRPRLILEVEQ